MKEIILFEAFIQKARNQESNGGGEHHLEIVGWAEHIIYETSLSSKKPFIKMTKIGARSGVGAMSL